MTSVKQPTGGKTRLCAECKLVTFPVAGRRIVCGEACATKRQQRQLAEATALRSEARGQQRAAKPATPCSVCRTPFKPRSSRSLYCGDKCRAEGLEQAVQRQRQRRQQAAQQRQQTVVPVETQQ